MNRLEVEVLAIGAGPGNLALAVALEELAPELARETVIVEQYEEVLWQRGMLLPWSQSQVSYLKDLVTLRNPQSRFSFISYLHKIGRLNDFINLGCATPYRLEISDYLSWVARNLSDVRIQGGRRCMSIEPEISSTDSEISSWLVQLSDGTEVSARNLVVGTGRDPHVPAEFRGLPRDRVIHSTEYAMRIDSIDPANTGRVVVVGGAQSAAEMLWATHQQFPQAQCTMVMRSIGLNCYESSRFTNELYYPEFVDEFHSALPEAREQLLREMHRSNYSGLAPGLLEVLYRQIYLDRVTGADRLRMRTMVEIAGARMVDGEVEITLRDRKNGDLERMTCDLVLLGTGFEKTMPGLVRGIAGSVGVSEITVDRNYRMQLPAHIQAGCYLQGLNEATHGIADTLLSVLAIRAQEIVQDMLLHSRQPTPELVTTVPMPS
ncbi:MAG TPA: SidA/IucD/PvdA family monooxygenase [Jatrophihabitans sp.]|nr:SidA/IucD/PvdA family monooxygenase [Jatrophihabitans sp.]